MQIGQKRTNKQLNSWNITKREEKKRKKLNT